MFHLFDYLHDSFFDEKNEVAGSAGLLYGCYAVLTILPPVSQLEIMPSWETVIALFKSFVVLAIMPMVSSLGKEFYEKRVSPKLFKSKENGKTKKNKVEKRA